MSGWGIGQGIPPGTQWLQQVREQRRRDNPEDMFSGEQNYERNKVWAKPGPYWTKLPPDKETQFRQWVKQNSVNFNPEDAQPDYDMRGFWQALQAGDPRAASAIDPNDKQIHYPDYWKTPYDATFSAQSQWGIEGKTPTWNGDQYTLPGGHVIYDDQAGRWYGLPQ